MRCAGRGVSAAAVPASKSVIYIYRMNALLGTPASPMVTCGHESIEIESGGYYSFIQYSGPVSCSATSESKTEYKFDAGPGEQYFVKEEVGPDYLSERTQFKLVSPELARDEIATCRRQGISGTTVRPPATGMVLPPTF